MMSHLSVHWWSFPPYTVAPASTNGLLPFSGIFSTILTDVFTSCGTNVSLEFHQVENPRGFEAMPAPHAPAPGVHPVQVLLPFTTDKQQVWFLELAEYANMTTEFVELMESPGAVLFYEKDEEPVGSDLLTVILQGWPLLILILLGAGYSGIIVWLLDRLWNPSNFPKPFLRGFWEGFWWAFVTMTTVGYGDTTPRSFQARIFGLIWIVVGITILSVFTATVTTVLTQESMGAHHYVMGSKVGVVNGTEEYRLVITEGGKPVAASNFDSFHAMTTSSSVSSMLVDQYYFMSAMSRIQEDVLVERRLAHPMLHGLLITQPAASSSPLTDCLRRNIRQARGLAFRELISQIQPLTTPTTTTAESTQPLFQAKTVTYMWYGLGAWLVVFVTFIIWEFAYWRPKHKRSQAAKRKRRIELPPSIGSDDSVGNSQPSITDDFSKNGDVEKSSLSPKLYNGIPLSRNSVTQLHFYGNTAFESDDSGLSKKGKLTEVSSVDSLIRKQREEKDIMEGKFEQFKSKWDQQMLSLKRLHREERRKLLRLIDHEDNFRNETGRENLDIPDNKNGSSGNQSGSSGNHSGSSGKHSGSSGNHSGSSGKHSDSSGKHSGTFGNHYYQNNRSSDMNNRDPAFHVMDRY